MSLTRAEVIAYLEGLGSLELDALIDALQQRLGLAPVVVRDIYAAFPKIRATGASIVIIEQDIGQALKVADRVYCMMEGRVTLSGTGLRARNSSAHIWPQSA